MRCQADGREYGAKEEGTRIPKITVEKKKTEIMKAQGTIKLPGNISSETGGDWSPEVPVFN